MCRDKILLYLKNKLKESRFDHILRVEDLALSLADRYGLDKDKVSKAALLHDSAKGRESELLKIYSVSDIIGKESIKRYWDIVHGPLGKEVAKNEFAITDEDILNSIAFHTSGRKSMTLMEKIVYVADFSEIGRSHKKAVEVRSMAYECLDEAVLMAMDSTLSYLIENKKIIFPLSIIARNYLIEKMKEKGAKFD